MTLPEGYHVRAVAQAEADILTRIHEECFPRYWNRDAFTDFFAVSNTFALLVEKQGEPAAMLVYRAAGEQADVLTLAVRPPFRRRGIAEALLVDALQHVATLGVQAFFLEVEVGNDAAIALYEKQGFSHLSRRKLYYQQSDGSLTDALVMRKKV